MKLTIRTLSANTWDYTYHDDGGMYQITCTDFSGTPFAQTYLGDGRLDTISFPNGLSAGDLYKDQEDNKSWKTDKMPYLRKTSVKDGSTTVLSWAYDRDSGGREMATTDKDGKYFPNTLDPLGRSSVESKWDSKTSSTRNYQFAYAFDANGNRISAFADGVVEQFTYGDANQLLTGLGTYTYDHFLNMATRVADTANWTLPYDFESRLIQAFDDYSTEVTDTHTWAADGRRMAASWNNGSENVQFIYDPITGNLIGEFYGDGTTFIQNALYTWGVTLLAQKRGGTVSYYHLDGNGSVRALSNSSKTITDTYSYNAFGEIVSSTGSTVNPFRWLGGAGIYDDGARGSVFGLNNIGSGMYAPVLARQLRRQTQLGTEALIGGLIGADLGFLFDSGKGVGTTSGTITFCEKLCKQLVCPFKKLIGFLCKKWCEGYCRGLGKNIKPSSVIEKICLLKATNWDDCDSCCKDVCAKEYLVGGDFYGACYSSCQQSCTLKF